MDSPLDHDSPAKEPHRVAVTTTPLDARCARTVDTAAPTIAGQWRERAASARRKGRAYRLPVRAATWPSTRLSDAPRLRDPTDAVAAHSHMGNALVRVNGIDGFSARATAFDYGQALSRHPCALP